MSVDVEKGKYTKPEGSKTWEYLICFTCMIMAIVIGAVQGWSSPGIMVLMAPDSPISAIASDAGTLVALVPIGYMIATPLSMYLVDKIGRKKVILMSALPMAIAWGLIMIGMNIWVIYVARFLKGIATGLFINLLPIYSAEVTSPCLRGTALTLNATLFNIGILMAYVIVPYMSLAASSAIFMSITVVFFVLFCFMPESPYYLAMNGRTDDSEAVLEKLRGNINVSDEMELILETVKSNSRQRTGRLRELITVRAYRRAFNIINIILCSLHFGGFYTILSYVQLIFKSLTNVFSDHTTAIVLGVVQVIFTLFTAFLVDRLGRRPLLLLSGVVVAVTNLAIAMFFYARDYLYMDMSAYSMVLFVMTIVLMCANNCGVVSLFTTVQSEIFATEIKALATCFGGIIGAVFHIISSKTYILIAVEWDYGPMPPFLWYFVNVVICTAVIFCIMPETKGKTFVQIQKELDD